MRRFEVYFLQKKIGGVWDTLERAQSVSVLVASLVREFDAREDAEVRILAGAYDEGAGAWEYSQIFFVDRGAIELDLAERDDADDFGPEEADDAVPGGHDFAAAIRRASDERGADSDEPPAYASHAEAVETDDDDSWARRRSRPKFDDDPLDDEAPVGPPPSLHAHRRRSGQAFFMIGTIVIALILTGAAVLALGIALDAPQVRPLLSMFRGMSGGMEPHEASGGAGAGAVMPETAGQVLTYKGVAPSLRGRWSPGRCDETYVEFDADGLVVGAPGRPESLKVPVVETIEDDFTWFVRRSPDLVEHFQKLGPNDLQLVGDTTRVGFSSRTSDILTRCP